ncbi:MAG: hypothetical protein ACE5MH_08385 [Terriglobia bacterium]
MRALLDTLLEAAELDADQVLDWVRRHRGALLAGSALLLSLVLLVSGPSQTAERPQADLTPDETPLFI